MASLGPRLDLRQAQSLVITPQLQAAIRLLALSNLELQAHIAEELERNPLLELEGEGEGAIAAPEAPPAAGEVELPDAVGALAAGDAAPDADFGEDGGADRFHHDGVADRPGDAGEDDGLGLDRYAAPAETLRDALLRQAGAALSGRALLIAQHLIDLIDDSGYLTEPCAAVAERLNAPLADVEAALGVIHGFEPTGVGARGLAECLALQAKEADRYDPCMAALLDNLELVARGDLGGLRRVCDVDAEDLADMLRELRGYDPRPGLRYGGSAAQTLVPDVLVTRGRDGWRVELNGATLPRLLVNRRYQAALTRDGDKACRQFVEECAQQAGWLARALDQRAQTILKVATELVRRQQGFFDHGVSNLRPLTLRHVADAIDMHESTVSRVTSNKWLHCDRGLFELKSFFTGGVATDDGEAASVSAVKARLRALIGAEDPLKPVSDDKLVELLRAEGYDLARRTVAKYREALNIPTSYDRRRRALVRAA